MMEGRKIDGRHFFSRKLASASKAAYPTKKIVKVALKRCSDMGISSVKWAILALPMLVRSRKQMR
jgi:hypothetical protein